MGRCKGELGLVSTFGASLVQPADPRLDGRNAGRNWLGPAWPTCPPFWVNLIMSDGTAAFHGTKRQKPSFPPFLISGWIDWTGWTSTIKTVTSRVQPSFRGLDRLDRMIRASASAVRLASHNQLHPLDAEPPAAITVFASRGRAAHPVRWQSPVFRYRVRLLR